jgi:hypothetical protein
VSERESELEGFLRRLKVLGATPDEIESTRVGWDMFDEDWTPDRRAALCRSSDGHIRAEIGRIRAEYLVGTTTEADAADARLAALDAKARDEAFDRMGLTVPALLAWVGNDAHRARAVEHWEASMRGAGRATLLRAVRAVTDATAP